MLSSSRTFFTCSKQPRHASSRVMTGIIGKTAATLALTVVLSSTAVADAVLSGAFWNEGAGTLANIDQAIAAANARTADATFLSTSIDYGDALGTVTRPFDWGIGTLAEFLNADAGTINPASVATQDIQESVFRFTGSVLLTNGEAVSVTSDDGFRLIIDGSTFSEFTGIRAPNNTTSVVWGEQPESMTQPCGSSRATKRRSNCSPT